MLERLRLVLVAWYATILAISVLGLGAAGIAALHFALVRDIDSTLISTARVMRDAFAETPPGSDLARWKSEISDETQEIAGGFGLGAARLVTPEGLVITWGRLALPNRPVGFSNLDVPGGPFRIFSSRYGEASGSLELAMSERTARNLAQKAWVALAVVSPLLLLVAVGGGIWLANRALLPVRRAFGRLKEFTSDVSHELRTPLATLQAEVDVALSKRDPSSLDLLERLARIGRTTDRMSRLVADLLVWVRQESGGLRIRPEAVQMADLLEETAQALALVHPEVAIRPEADKDLECACDPTYLRQALGNLVDNAARHSPKGAEIALRARSLGGKVVVEVQDHGSGIRPEHLPHLFDRFYRVGERSGLGIGLAITKAIVQAHGGTLEVDSIPGTGTRFWFGLPATARAARSTKTPQV